MSKIKVAIIGTGSISKHHINGYLQNNNVELYAFCDINEVQLKKMGEKYGIEFVPYDFRPRFKEGQEEAREAGLYMQKYCGCVFSEEERYLKKNKIIP